MALKPRVEKISLHRVSMVRNYRLCPVCEKKFLAGLHQKVCIRNYPGAWCRYEISLVLLSAGRRGRSELLAGAG